MGYLRQVLLVTLCAGEHSSKTVNNIELKLARGCWRGENDSWHGTNFPGSCILSSISNDKRHRNSGCCSLPHPPASDRRILSASSCFDNTGAQLSVQAGGAGKVMSTCPPRCRSEKTMSYSVLLHQGHDCLPGTAFMALVDFAAQDC
jgi:hypothetical protein